MWSVVVTTLNLTCYFIFIQNLAIDQNIGLENQITIKIQQYQLWNFFDTYLTLMFLFIVT